MSRVRVACVGTGFIAGKHLDALNGFDDVDVVAVADPDERRATDAAARCGARAYATAQQLLDAEELDAIWLCVPPFAHGALEEAVLARGLPFFVEKPLALDVGTAEAIAATVAEQGLVTAVGYHWRYLDVVEAAQVAFARAPVRLLVGAWLDLTPTAPWWSRSAGSGGQLLEQATHLFDLARLLVGEVESVYAQGQRTPRASHPDADVADVSVATLRFATGALGTITSTCLLDWHDRIGLHLVAPGTSVELTERTLRVRTAAGERTSESTGNPFVAEDRDFVDAVKGEADRIRVPYAEALRTHMLTTSAVRSIDQGTPVDVPIGVGRA